MNQQLKALLFSTLFGIFLLTGCDKKDPFDSGSPVPAPKSIVDIVTGDRNFSRLAQAVTRANLVGALGGAALTVFAPSNAAFAAGGLDSATIAKTDPAALSAILRYHVLGSTVRSSDLQTGINKETTTLNGAAYVSKFDFGTPAVAVNGVRVTLLDVAATNGVVHVVDNLLMPPTGSVMDVVRSSPNFTFLLAAVTRANLATALSGAGPLTVFAPSNDAFISTTPFKTLAQINVADPAALAAILTYHVTPGRVFTTNFVPEAYPVSGGIVVSSDAKKPGKISTLSGKIINISGDLKLTGLGNGTDASTVTRANMLVSNGVIHIIDRVLLPQ